MWCVAAADQRGSVTTSARRRRQAPATHSPAHNAQVVMVSWCFHCSSALQSATEDMFEVLSPLDYQMC